MCNTPPIPYSFCTMPLYSTTELISNSHLGTTPAKYGSCSREISCRGWRNITFIMEVVGIIFTRCGNHQFSNMPDPVAGEEGPWTPVLCRVQSHAESRNVDVTVFLFFFITCAFPTT